MSRTTGSSGQATIEAIYQAGLRLIYQHGYEAMTLRQLAAEIGLVQGSLYNHIVTKQELLFKLITNHMQDLLAHASVALQGIDSPSERLFAFAEFHVNYHIDRKQEVFICYSELRSLTPENFNDVVAMRRDYEQILIDILKAGASQGVFILVDPKTSAFGILSMLSGICTWFKPNGPLTKTQVCAVFVDMARGAVGDKTAMPKRPEIARAKPASGKSPISVRARAKSV